MRDLNDKITGNTLTAIEWNDIPTELQNIIEAFGIVLSGGDLNQVGKGLANYVAGGQFYVDTGAADAHAVAVVGSRQAPTAYTNGMVIKFIPVATNLTLSPTVNVAGLGIKDIVSLQGGGVALGYIDPNAMLSLRFSSGDDAFIVEDYSAQLQFAGEVKALATLVGLTLGGLVSSIIVNGASTNPFISANSSNQLQLKSVIGSNNGVGIRLEEIGTGAALKEVLETVRHDSNGASIRLSHDGTPFLETIDGGIKFFDALLDDIDSIAIVGKAGDFSGVTQRKTDNINSTFRTYYTFLNNASGVVGRIRCNSTSTQYLTSSDYRLKDDFIPLNRDDSWAVVKDLNPGTFSWKSTGVTVSGFLAHELQIVIPDAASGTKDEEEDDGTHIYQGVDQSKIVPDLTAALKHAIAAIEILEAKMAALENV